MGNHQFGFFCVVFTLPAEISAAEATANKMAKKAVSICPCFESSASRQTPLLRLLVYF